MKKFFLLFTSFLLIGSLFAQQNPPTQKTQEPVAPPKKKQTINLAGRANDHLLVQLGYAGWNGTPDSIRQTGASKSLNIYFMFDFPFKTSPKLSVGVGAGIGSDQMKFSKTFVDIKSQSTHLPFIDQSDTSHFKRTKLATAYLEAPVELRYTSNPLNSDRSFKAALGIKVGTMLSAHTRYKDLQNASGGLLNAYVMKESSKKFFNTTRLVVTGRVGWGHFSVFGAYQVSQLFKDGVAAVINPWSVGLTLSGL